VGGKILDLHFSISAELVARELSRSVPIIFGPRAPRCRRAQRE
jgi:hypothetical protein